VRRCRLASGGRFTYVQAVSWEEQFYLPRAVATYAADEIAGRVRKMLPSTTVTATVEADLISIQVRFALELVDQIAAVLGSSPQKWLNYDWRRDLDPPRDEGRDYYEIVVELVEMEHSELRVASSTADNRAAWPLAFALAGRLAEEYEATEEPAPAPEELN